MSEQPKKLSCGIGLLAHVGASRREPHFYIFIKINGSCFLPFVKSCFHEIPPKLGNFSRLKSRESGWIFRWKVSKRYRHRLKHSHRIFAFLPALDVIARNPCFWVSFGAEACLRGSDHT